MFISKCGKVISKLFYTEKFKIMFSLFSTLWKKGSKNDSYIEVDLRPRYDSITTRMAIICCFIDLDTKKRMEFFNYPNISLNGRRNFLKI